MRHPSCPRWASVRRSTVLRPRRDAPSNPSHRPPPSFVHRGPSAPSLEPPVLIATSARQTTAGMLLQMAPHITGRAMAGQTPPSTRLRPLLSQRTHLLRPYTTVLHLLNLDRRCPCFLPCRPPSAPPNVPDRRETPHHTTPGRCHRTNLRTLSWTA